MCYTLIVVVYQTRIPFFFGGTFDVHGIEYETKQKQFMTIFRGFALSNEQTRDICEWQILFRSFLEANEFASCLEKWHLICLKRFLTSEGEKVKLNLLTDQTSVSLF